MKITSMEARIEHLLAGHPQLAKTIKLAHVLEKEGQRLVMSGLDPAAVLLAMSLPAIACAMAGLSTQRIGKELVHDIVEDFIDSVEYSKAAPPEQVDEYDGPEEEQPIPEAPNPTGDLFVNLPSMAGAHLQKVRFDAAYESMVEDIIGNFNHIVSQGVPPIIALYAMTQAYALTLGNCLRADLPWPLAQRLMRTIMKNATTFEKMVRTVTN